MPYADNVVRVSVVKVYVGDVEFPFSNNIEIKFVKDVVGTFVGCPTRLVKPISHQVMTIVINTYTIFFVTWLHALIVYVSFW